MTFAKCNALTLGARIARKLGCSGTPWLKFTPVLEAVIILLLNKGLSPGIKHLSGQNTLKKLAPFGLILGQGSGEI